MFETKNRTEGAEMLVLGRYQLTHPRRLMRLAAILAMSFGISILGITGSFAGNAEPIALEFVTIQAGDSLWNLADQHGAGQDPRDWIAKVVKLNALVTVELRPGQQIALP
ncbi:LysM peptidoglycan-binding domain-containing protein [Aquiluna sp.]|nr:LysM peptidoglycan-binding domain-containing protein [Aquiluna sp.]MDB4018462.1 LysM peptidoglycan-binding domain-containing protein [Aquiluna sp.]